MSEKGLISPAIDALRDARLFADAKSLLLPDDLSVDQWDHVGERLRGMSLNVQWWWGDWLNHGEARYGKKYAKAVKNFGLNKRSAQQYAWVARVYESTKRLELSWSHHLFAAGVQDQSAREALLHRACAERWSVSRLKSEIECAFGPPGMGASSTEEQFDKLINAIHLACSACTEWLDRSGADQFGPLTDLLQAELEKIRRRLGHSGITVTNKSAYTEWRVVKHLTLHEVRDFCNRQPYDCPTVIKDLQDLTQDVREISEHWLKRGK